MVETKVPRFCFFFSFFFGSFSLVLFFINFSMKKIRPGAWVPASRPVRATRLWSGHGSRPGRAQVGLCGVVVLLISDVPRIFLFSVRFLVSDSSFESPRSLEPAN